MLQSVPCGKAKLNGKHTFWGVNNQRPSFRESLPTEKRGVPVRSEPVSEAPNSLYKICPNL